jgi:hypothetical protein
MSLRTGTLALSGFYCLLRSEIAKVWRSSRFAERQWRLPERPERLPRDPLSGERTER